MLVEVFLTACQEGGNQKRSESSLGSGVDLLLTFGLLAYWFEPAPYARLTGR